jgi:hypothetical protein
MYFETEVVRLPLPCLKRLRGLEQVPAAQILSAQAVLGTHY